MHNVLGWKWSNFLLILLSIICCLYDSAINIPRPGSDPSKAGANAPRPNYQIQHAIYNGCKHSHGIKYWPNGMALNVYGPC